jgi:hypothetical protein
VAGRKDEGGGETNSKNSYIQKKGEQFNTGEGKKVNRYLGKDMK